MVARRPLAAVAPMNGPACALALLIVLAPLASADAQESQVIVPQAEAGCDFFSYTLTPPDYRIDEDCLDSLTP